MPHSHEEIRTAVLSIKTIKQWGQYRINENNPLHLYSFIGTWLIFQNIPGLATQVLADCFKCSEAYGPGLAGF